MSNILFSWQFNSKKQRWNLWYLIVFSITIWLIIWGFLSKQYVMSFVIILLTWLSFYIENNSNDIVWVQITEDWIKIDNNFYPFANISSYSIIYEWENAILLRLYLKQKVWIWLIDINIDNSISKKVKNILEQILEENQKTELTFIEKITRLLKL